MQRKTKLPNWWWKEEEGEEQDYANSYSGSTYEEELRQQPKKHRKVREPYEDINQDHFSVILNDLLESLNEQKLKSEELEKILNIEKKNISSLVLKITKLEEVNFALREAVRAISGSDPNKILGLEPEEEQKLDEPLVIPYLFVSRDAPREIFDAVFRAAIKIYHPDVGGNEETMKEVNLIKDKIYVEKGWN